jgi:hypothetical protein
MVCHPAARPPSSSLTNCSMVCIERHQDRFPLLSNYHAMRPNIDLHFETDQIETRFSRRRGVGLFPTASSGLVETASTPSSAASSFPRPLALALYPMATSRQLSARRELRTHNARILGATLPISARPVSVVQEAPQLPAPARVLQLAQRLRLDLADPLAGHVELLADLFQRVVGVHPDTEPHAQHTLLARRQ